MHSSGTIRPPAIPSQIPIRVNLEINPKDEDPWEVEMEQDMEIETRYTTDLSIFELAGEHTFRARLEYETFVTSGPETVDCQ